MIQESDKWASTYQYFVDESVSMAKIGLSNTIPPLPIPPFPIPGIGITHPKENIQRKHLPGELQGGMAAPKVETKRGALHTCLWKAGLGLSRCLWKLDLNGMHTHYRQRGAKERELRACTRMRVRVCTMTFFPTTPSENIIFLHEKWGTDRVQEWHSNIFPFLENRELGTNDRFLFPWVGARLVLFIPSQQG